MIRNWWEGFVKALRNILILHTTMMNAAMLQSSQQHNTINEAKNNNNCNNNSNTYSSSSNNNNKKTQFYIFISNSNVHNAGTQETDALDQWCLRKLLGIKWYHHVRHCAEWWCETENRAITSFGYCQAWHLSLFGHTVRLPDKSDAKQILTASLLENWRRPPGCPHTTWMKTTQHDLKSLNLSRNEATDVAQNRPLWRLTSMSGAMHSQWCLPEMNEWMNSNTNDQPGCH